MDDISESTDHKRIDMPDSYYGALAIAIAYVAMGFVMVEKFFWSAFSVVVLYFGLMLFLVKPGYESGNMSEKQFSFYAVGGLLLSIFFGFVLCTNALRGAF